MGLVVNEQFKKDQEVPRVVWNIPRRGSEIHSFIQEVFVKKRLGKDCPSKGRGLKS
jgi:hypothetical protein